MTVLEPQLFSGQLLALPPRHGDRRRHRMTQDLQFGRPHLDISRRELGVSHVGWTRDDLAEDPKHGLALDARCLIAESLGRVGADRHLHHARPVAQVEEDDATEVAPAMHPAAEFDHLPPVLEPQLAAPMRALGGATDVGYGTSASHTAR